MTQATALPDWMTAERPDDLVAVAADDADVVALFLALATQWRWHEAGFRLGLDYSAVRPTAEMSGLAVDAGTFADLRLMESAALARFDEAAR